MYKSLIITLALVSTLAFTLASPLPEGADVREAAKEAFRRGIDRFGDRVSQYPKPAPVEKPADAEKEKIFSLYTKDLKAPGGGKPATNEQYRKNHYDAPVPTVIPVENKVVNPEKMTPKEAAAMYKPRQPLQFTTDRLY